MKKKSKPMTSIARVKLLESQTALTDARTYEHADQLKQLGEQFDKLAKIVAADFQTHTRRIVEINERLPDKAQIADFVNLQKRITNLGEQTNLRLDEHSAAINKLGAFADDVNKQLGDIKPREQLDPRFTETVRENLLRAPLRMDTLEKRIDKLDSARAGDLQAAKREALSVQEVLQPALIKYAEDCIGRDEKLFRYIDALEKRLAALEYPSGVRCNVPTEPTPGWQKTVNFGTILITKPSLWQKFKRFLGF